MAGGESLKPQITFGKFQNVDMRVARIVGCRAASGTHLPCKVISLDLGPLGLRESVGQFALFDDDELIGKYVVVCINLGSRQMGDHESQVLLMGVRHPLSPPDQIQATPLEVDARAELGSVVY